MHFHKLIKGCITIKLCFKVTVQDILIQFTSEDGADNLWVTRNILTFQCLETSPPVILLYCVDCVLLCVPVFRCDTNNQRSKTSQIKETFIFYFDFLFLRDSYARFWTCGGLGNSQFLKFEFHCGWFFKLKASNSYFQLQIKHTIREAL